MSRKSKCHRHPRTTQEIRENLNKHDPLIRAKRRNIPTAWDDLVIHRDKCWKSTRKTQYREDKANYQWHEFPYSYWDSIERDLGRTLCEKLEESGCYFEFTLDGIRWFGPEFRRKGNV